MHRNSMCPTRHALLHPAAGLLKQWATFGCPTHTGQPWSKEEIWVAVARGPHQSALSPAAIMHFAAEAAKKVCTKHACIVAWEEIKDDPPKQLKILPIATIPHKSKDFRSILDLSFRLRLANGGVRAAVNNTTKRTAPKGAIDQIGECLQYPSPLCRLIWAVTHVIGLHLELTTLGECDVALTTIFDSGFFFFFFF
jgi:hypothetical protein